MILDSCELQSDDFYAKYVSVKEPLLVKKFLNSNELLSAINENRKSLTKVMGRGSAEYLYLYFNSPILDKHLFRFPLIKKLAENPKIEFRKNYRLWEHDKGKVSPFHYDKNSIDILNICISGAKYWRFVSPQTPIKCFPFLNICVPFAKKSHCHIIGLKMEAGDLIYIPRNWFHSVETLEDNTKNLNMIFFDSGDQYLYDRERELAALHKLISPSYSYSFNRSPSIEKAIRSTPLIHIIKRTFIELQTILVLLAALFLISSAV